MTPVRWVGPVPRRLAFAPILALAALCGLPAWASPGLPGPGPDGLGISLAPAAAAAPAERPEGGGPEKVAGIALSPYGAGHDPDEGRHPGPAEVARDVALLAGHTTALRTYGSLAGGGLVPEAAGRLGIDVMQGAWLSGDDAADEAELQALARLAALNPNVTRVLAGNEAILHGDLDSAKVIAHMGRVRRETGLPVSTAEPWHIWLNHPELAREADFIAVHILPYWDGVPVEEAAGYVLRRYRELEGRYPGKPIVIVETGWPDQGTQRGGAVPSAGAQARFVADFLRLARSEGLDYFLLEAFDQPWKSRREGDVGGAWGLWRADRTPKPGLHPLP